MPHILKRLNLLMVGFFITAAVSPCVMAGEIVKSKYLTVYADAGIDKAQVLKKLSADYYLRLGPAFSASSVGGEGLDGMLAKTLDALYLEVSDVLDIHMYDFNVDLEILRDRAAIAEVLRPYFGGKDINMPSFYYHNKKKIYVSLADLNAGMLAHEISHSIISHYFIVPPPAKMQEVLSGYVEYAVRKHTAK